MGAARAAIGVANSGGSCGGVSIGNCGSCGQDPTDSCGIVGVGICVLGSVVADLGSIITIAVGWPDRLSQVWFNLFYNTLIASSSANSLIVTIMSLFVH